MKNPQIFYVGNDGHNVSFYLRLFIKAKTEFKLYLSNTEDLFLQC